jgi:hypothetical protein
MMHFNSTIIPVQVQVVPPVAIPFDHSSVLMKAL